MKYTILFVLSSAAALYAGPPLICHPGDIGNAKSLPWKVQSNWNGADPHYDVRRLVGDTLEILTPSAPLAVRMETLRRAAIYTAKNDTLAETLASRLVARIADSEAAGKPDPNAWFDAGYFVEGIRQLGFIYRYSMLSPSEKAEWKVRGDSPGLDGKPWIDHAIRLGGKGMEVALAKIDEFRQADLKRSNALVSSAK
ncbi:MAG TPA: hypothetical protein VGL53_18145 [Bryobacteraceae bacterium]|jgi:hypothetical protein